MDEHLNEHAEDTLSRRHFLSMTWRASGLLVLGTAAFHGARYLSTTQDSGVFGQVITAGSQNDFPMPSVTYFGPARFYLVRFDDGGFLALYSKCTHLACVVNWDEAQSRFVCPCHGSEFAMDGEVQNPPAPRALDRFPVTFKRGNVLVDTGQRIEQDALLVDVLAYPEEL